ncbi:MAG: RNA polymerase sigma factor RpoH [Proteobacteria bacterium]|nr:RNA polymerase sigma factor RpoH [Pseudomonadota bacterium]MCL2307041.1 RNA polymerase sigma factor RpoH [Pseudomonadota bacterium]
MTSQSLVLPTPASLGSLDHYIQAINRFPLLTAEQETSLARRWRDEQDLNAARDMVLSHLRLVVAVSRQYLGYGLPQADLIQEGNIGLMKAVRRFDPERGVRLVSFALHWIRAEIHEYVLRNWRIVKMVTTKAQRKLFFNLRSMKEGTEALTQKEANEIARTLNVKPEEVLDMETRLAGGEVSLDPMPESEEEYHVSPVYYLTNKEDEPAHIVETEQTERHRRETLQKALASLDERSAAIVRARWLRDEDEAAVTLQELAEEYGVSAERIRQIEARALKKMREVMV